MKSILFVVDEMKYGGVSNALIETLRNLKADLFSLDLLVLHPHGEMLKSIPQTVNVIYGSSFYKTVDVSFSALKKDRNIGGMLQKAFMAACLKTGIVIPYIRNQRKKLLKKNYDIEVAYKDGFCTVFTYSGDTQCKLAWIHNDYGVFTGSDRYPYLMKKVFSSMDGIVAVSKRAAAALCAKFDLKVNPCILLNPINKERIKELSSISMPDYPDDSLNFVSVGRICDQKGYDRLLRVHTKLINEKLFHRIYIVGNGEDEDKLHAQVKEYNVSDTFIMLGYQENPYPYIKKADCYVMSSRHEASPIVINESLLLKTPIISTDVADVADRLFDGCYGIVVDNSEDALYKGMKNIITNKDIIEEHKFNLSTYNYDESEIVNKINQFLLRSVITVEESNRK